MDATQKLETSQRLFVRLVRVYPPGFRQAYGEQVAQLFRDSSREALHTAGTVA